MILQNAKVQFRQSALVFKPGLQVHVPYICSHNVPVCFVRPFEFCRSLSSEVKHTKKSETDG